MFYVRTFANIPPSICLTCPHTVAECCNCRICAGKTGGGEQKKYCPPASKDRRERRTKHQAQFLVPEPPISSVPRRHAQGVELEKERVTSIRCQLTFPTPGSLSSLNSPAELMVGWGRCVPPGLGGLALIIRRNLPNTSYWSFGCFLEPWLGKAALVA